MKFPKLDKIKGATFNEKWNVKSLQEAIDKLPKRDSKLRILFLGEASFLKTGFAIYWGNVLHRLHATGKYEIAELGSYASTNDPRAQEIPWKFYGIMPEPNDQAGLSEYGRPDGNSQERARYSENQFGKGKFDTVLADFRPDIVVDLRDHWMVYWQKDSVFRDNFHWMWMACVDSYPQQWRWLNDYGKADTLLTYSFFGERVLQEQSRSPIAQMMGLPPLDVSMVAQPGIDLDIYKQLDKNVIKQEFNIPPNIQFVGTVMRNQKRKLFPRLIESFRMFKEQNGWGQSDQKKKRIRNIDNIKLLLHTSVQDVGFDIPEVVRREGLQEEVFFSYLCPECGVYGISTLLPQHPAICPQCKKQSFMTPNTQIGLPDEDFVKIFNMMDVYAQMSIAEGDGMPVQNAKACHVPVIMSDYAALSEKCRNGGGTPVKGDVETESETMQWRHWFNRDDFVIKLTKLFRKKGLLEKKGREARQCVEQYYSWNLTAKKWEYLLDSVEVKDRSSTWDLKRNVSQLPSDQLNEREDITNEQFIDACYAEILKKEPDEEGRTSWLQNLENGQPRKAVEKYFRRIINKRNMAAQLLGCGEDGAPNASMHPIEKIAKAMDPKDEFRILYCMPETAGDILISTAIINRLADEYPEASIYVATQEKYFNILKNNPDVKGVVPFNQALENYRTAEPFGPSPGFVEFCFCPYIITQRIPHWIHGGKGESLGVSYAHMCNLTMTDEEIAERLFIECEPVECDWKCPYVTFHAKTTQDPKDYEDWDAVFERLKDITIVQIGSANEPLLDYPNLIDLRGKTTPQQLASVIAGAELHIGQDSFPAHIANAVGTKSIIIYGGTYAKQGGLQNSIAIEPEYRNGCHTSCHLIDCMVKQQGGDKCINNISPELIVDSIQDCIGAEYIAPEKTTKISAYCIIKDGIRYGFPFEECIGAALEIADEFVMVDGGSTDGTCEKLKELAAEESRLKVFWHMWDMDDAMVMGNEKTYAREQCTGDYLIQLDADEIIVEKQPGQIRQLIKRNRNVLVFDFPVVNFYGNDNIMRYDQSIWKWRVTKNDPVIIHGVHAAARDFDCETMKITFDKKVSDGCEYINRNTLEIIPHKSILPLAAHQLHDQIHQLRSQDKEVPEHILGLYRQLITDMVANIPIIFHYSFYDLEQKKKRGKFWENTWHGKNAWTHGTTEDITDRIDNNKELVFSINIEHPLKVNNDRTISE